MVIVGNAHAHAFVIAAKQHWSRIGDEGQILSGYGPTLVFSHQERLRAVLYTGSKGSIESLIVAPIVSNATRDREIHGLGDIPVGRVVGKLPADDRVVATVQGGVCAFHRRECHFAARRFHHRVELLWHRREHDGLILQRRADIQSLHLQVAPSVGCPLNFHNG